MNVPAQAHIACAPVAALLAQAPGTLAWLSATEQERHASMQSVRRRAQFIAARWQARLLLADVLGGAPQDWPLAALPDAPPQLLADPALHISVSHSGDWAACALAPVALGLDLEAPGRRRDIDGLVDLCCTPGEQALFAGLDAVRRADLFYTLWTVKEAWLKRRRAWISPSRLRALDARPAADGVVRTWAAPQWKLALCIEGADVRWCGPVPAARDAWQLHDSEAG
ncbi:MAG: 4'-phosphopantetheinyl transferase superfamily protein [Comamonadaceae bacterium]|nr:MAG: 4'-phosphopantetheinyl transferase superfamily protein [Comamonadaceae bacterium]